MPLTTHVLDTAHGRPAQGVPIVVHRLDEGRWTPVARAFTNADGRTDAPLLTQLAAGTYEVTFAVGAYLGGEGFYDEIPIRFVVRDPAAHHHVPLLLSPWAYSTYRGS